MKINYRQPKETADINARQGSDMPEFIKLSLMAVVFVVFLYVVIGWAVDVAVSGIGYDREMRLFENIDLVSELGDQEEVPDSLQNVFDKLILNEQVPAIDYKLVVLQEPEPNAFAFPGGTIAVTSGLLESLSTDLELAFVLGHELGHFYNRDHLRGMGRALGLTIVYGLIFSSSLELDSVSSIPLMVMNASYSRGQESSADRFGLTLVSQTFGTTENFDTLFKVLEERQSQPGWAEMLSTHPLPRNRIEDLNEFVLQLENTTE